MPPADRYGTDVLNTDWRAPKRGRATETPASVGEVVEEITTDFCGDIVAVDLDLDTVTLEDRRRTRRTFPLGPGFLIDGIGPQGAYWAAATFAVIGLLVALVFVRAFPDLRHRDPSPIPDTEPLTLPTS